LPRRLRLLAMTGGLTCRTDRVCLHSTPGFLLAQNVNGRDTWLHL